jgi:cytosine/adenosine deaminase-related metal-dependent hydrolase
MLLNNIHIIGREGLQHIQIEDGTIKAVSDKEISSDELSITFENALAFPGLVNSHDHLDFNLFPQTGNRIYNNYTEWGKDIRENNQDGINAILKIPRPLRTRWGIYKNLLNGVTTVVNHGERLTITDSPITVFQDCYSLHSIHFENNWKYQLNRLFKKKGSYVIHIGEGTDAASCKEINTLTKWNLFKRKLIGVHGVAMNEAQAGRFHAVVWCPVSNFFLLNCTAPVDQLKKHTNIIFGTDSTLTADWNIWEQLRQARKTSLLTDEELLDAVTVTAATVWDLNTGAIAPGKDADIVIAKAKDHTAGMDAFYALNPEDILLVMHKGKIRLFDESLLDQLKIIPDIAGHFSRISIKGQFKFIEGNLPALINEIGKYNENVYLPVSKGQ